ncbi:hypothetical protein F4776DRAFT_354227 [Hypoxylon sp. NC0597]|nr:hypothetical protein F4776DRAFT_354227 [Hypoxylon sp. NC0597]
MAPRNKIWLEVQYSFETNQLTIYFPGKHHARAYADYINSNRYLSTLGLQPQAQERKVTMNLPSAVSRVRIVGRMDLVFVFKRDAARQARYWASNSILWKQGNAVVEQRLERHWSIADLDDLFMKPRRHGHTKKRAKSVGGRLGGGIPVLSDFFDPDANQDEVQIPVSAPVGLKEIAEWQRRYGKAVIV